MALSAAIVLAAGEGTRMRSNKPKVLHAFAGKTFLNRVMDSVAALNPDTLAVVVHFQAERVAEAARSYDEQVTIVNQDDIPGTGRAVQCAMAQLTEAGKVDGPVLIAASDMPLLDSETLHRLVEFHTASGNGATVLTTILDDPTGYGRIIRDREGNVLRIVEQKDANRSELAVQEVNTSVYVFEASVLTEAIAGLKSNNAQGEFYLTDALETAKAAGKVGAFAAPDPLTVEGVNDRVQLAALSKTYNRRVCERWMRDGVTILDPETTWIEDDVQIGRDATILPGSFLQGHTVVGEDAIVGPYTTLIDATVDEGAVVERSRVQESHIGARTNIGPWTYLRPGNEFGEDAKYRPDHAFATLFWCHVLHRLLPLLRFLRFVRLLRSVCFVVHRLRVLQRLLQCVGRVEMEFFFFVDLPSQAERADVLPVYGHFLRIVERLFHCLDRADRGNGEWRRILFALQKQHVAGTAHCGIEQHTLVHDHHGFRAARPKRVHHGFDVLLVHHVIVDVGGGAAGIDHVFPEW
mgnify:FL=1